MFDVLRDLIIIILTDILWGKINCVKVMIEFIKPYHYVAWTINYIYYVGK